MEREKILKGKNRAINKQILEIKEYGLCNKPKLFSLNKITFQPSKNNGKMLIQVEDNPIKFKFARLIHVSKIKKM